MRVLMKHVYVHHICVCDTVYTVQVGDRLDTDVLFGSNNGLMSLLVLSGVTSETKLLSKVGAHWPARCTLKHSIRSACQSAS
jgi:ribonucleotide monophosphatase NagD (HAD superfamily)